MSVGRLLAGRYEVGEVIGRGGMADVHAGFDTRLSRPVAVKLLRPELARDSSFLTRFRREAQSAAQLNHPSIVAVYDSGEERDTDAAGASITIAYIVMEVVHGQTLRQRLLRGALPADEAGRITEGVLAALAYSHRMGIVHRDIKPANVMIGPTGEIKVMDFGIARAVADSAATMTQTQAVVGTAQYLSPEQAQGKQVDARSDLYSTGCMLFELLTGRTPFVGETPVAIAYQHVGEEPQRPSQLRSDVPPAYDAIVLHAMVKDRDARYQSATDMLADLVCAREGRRISSAALGTAASAGVSTSGVTGATASTGAPGSAGTPTTVLDRPGATDDVATRVGRPVQDEAPPRRRGAAYVLLGLAAVGALVLLFLLGRELLSTSAKPDQVNVPYLIGLTEDQARTLLSSRKLVMDKRDVTNPDVAKGRVIDQDPPDGAAVDAGSAVRVSVSTGPGQAALPAVAGMSKDAAVTAVTILGFPAPTVVPVDDPSQAKDVALGTDPPAGSVVPLTTAVTIRVASGKVKVPGLVGQYTTTADSVVKGLKLVYEVTARVPTADPNVLEGTVLTQDPAPDTLVDVGTTIKVTYAVRPPPVTVTLSPPPPPPPTTSAPMTSAAPTTGPP